jgi:hypothetical protein
LGVSSPQRYFATSLHARVGARAFAALVRQEVADKFATASRNDAAPGFGVAFEGVALEGVNLVADEAGDGHRVRSWTDGLACNCAADDEWDASVEAEVC